MNPGTNQVDMDQQQEEAPTSNFQPNASHRGDTDPADAGSHAGEEGQQQMGSALRDHPAPS